jgi:hypothetical protein
MGIEGLVRERVFEILSKNSKVVTAIQGQEYKVFGGDIQKMIGNSHQIMSVFGKMPNAYSWSFSNALSVSGQKEHGARQGMYREMFSTIGWERLPYPAKKELIHFLSN